VESVDDDIGIYGDISKDLPVKIKRMIVDENGSFKCLVKWAMRTKTGVVPKSSYVDREIIKQKKPMILLEYYERVIKWIS
jgi:hypothetical protein